LHHCESFMQLKMLPWGSVEGGQGGGGGSPLLATGDKEFKGGVTFRIL
jgi:GTPase involved in cell partitioning and DNA repair